MDVLTRQDLRCPLISPDKPRLGSLFALILSRLPPFGSSEGFRAQRDSVRLQKAVLVTAHFAGRTSGHHGKQRTRSDARDAQLFSIIHLYVHEEVVHTSLLWYKNHGCSNLLYMFFYTTGTVWWLSDNTERECAWVFLQFRCSDKFTELTLNITVCVHFGQNIYRMIKIYVLPIF